MISAETYLGKVHKQCGTREKYVSCGVCVACTRNRERAKRDAQRAASRKLQTVRLQESY